MKEPLLDNTNKVANELGKDSDKQRHLPCQSFLFL